MSSHDEEKEKRRKELKERYREVGRKNIAALESAIEKRIKQGKSQQQIIEEVKAEITMHPDVIKRKVNEASKKQKGLTPKRNSFLGRWKKRK